MQQICLNVSVEGTGVAVDGLGVLGVVYPVSGRFFLKIAFGFVVGRGFGVVSDKKGAAVFEGEGLVDAPSISVL